MDVKARTPQMLIFKRRAMVAKNQQTLLSPTAVRHHGENASALKRIQNCEPKWFEHFSADRYAKLCNDSSTHDRSPRLNQFLNRIALQANPEPQFKIQQPPDSVAVIAMASGVFVKQSPHRVSP
jgi:hypothetical protein